LKVLLVVYDNDSYISQFPIGLAYVASILLGQGYVVEIYSQDVHHYPDNHLTKYLDDNKFDVVGISVIAGYHQYKKLLSLSDAINRSKNRPFYIIGGFGPSPEPKYFLEKTNADVVVMGEGEETTVELFDAIANKKPMKDIKGIAYRDGKKVIINSRRPLIPDIDSIPMPAYHLFPMEHYRLLRMPNCSASDFVMPMLSGRGCTFKCTFCYRMDKGFRGRLAGSILEEIRYLQTNYGITYISFFDELLMSSKKRTIELCEAFIHSGIKFKWDCNGRLNYATPEVLELMKRAGCVFINYGIEAMDNEVLKNMKKALTTDQIVKGIEATLKAGISPGFNIIFGNVGDNKETLQAGVDFLLKYDDGAQMRTIRPVTPYPGSPLYYDAINKGLLKDVDDFYVNKHTNSDLLAVNFTELTDEEFYEALTNANIQLMNNFFNRKRKSISSQIENLYKKRDATFRGFRQT